MHPEIRHKPEPAHEVIHELARQTHRPEHEVRAVYEQELAALEARARVKGYLTILARRRAKDVLSRP